MALRPFDMVVAARPFDGDGSSFSKNRSTACSRAFSKRVFDMPRSTRTVSSGGGPEPCLTLPGEQGPYAPIVFLWHRRIEASV
jgi:hypothetical protein